MRLDFRHVGVVFWVFSRRALLSGSLRRYALSAHSIDVLSQFAAPFPFSATVLVYIAVFRRASSPRVSHTSLSPLFSPNSLRAFSRVPLFSIRRCLFFLYASRVPFLRFSPAVSPSLSFHRALSVRIFVDSALLNSIFAFLLPEDPPVLAPPPLLLLAIPPVSLLVASRIDSPSLIPPLRVIPFRPGGVSFSPLSLRVSYFIGPLFCDSRD